MAGEHWHSRVLVQGRWVDWAKATIYKLFDKVIRWQLAIQNFLNSCHKQSVKQSIRVLNHFQNPCSTNRQESTPAKLAWRGRTVISIGRHCFRCSKAKLSLRCMSRHAIGIYPTINTPVSFGVYWCWRMSISTHLEDFRFVWLHRQHAQVDRQ
jgi:hypothetical protein